MLTSNTKKLVMPGIWVTLGQKKLFMLTTSTKNLVMPGIWVVLVASESKAPEKPSHADNKH